MNLQELFNILNNIPEFNGKVSYRAFPIGQCPELPFVCYLENQTNNFFADNSVFKKKTSVNVELYTELKNIELETKIEDALNRNMLPWEKTEDYIDSEKCFMITFNVEV